MKNFKAYRNISFTDDTVENIPNTGHAIVLAESANVPSLPTNLLRIKVGGNFLSLHHLG